MDDKPYEVGRGKPPKHTQFQKGKSGNPAGRPRKAKVGGGEDPLKLALHAPLVEATIKGRRVKMSAAEAMLRKAVAAALKGDAAEAIKIFEYEIELMKTITGSIEGRRARHRGPIGYMAVPRILPMNVWTAMAVKQQARLVADTRDHSRNE